MFSVYWAGWFKEGTSDKIWGVLRSDNGTYYNFWCRRGAKMQFKHTHTNKYSHKRDKGYKEITTEKLEEIYPGFMDEVSQQLMFAVFSERVR